MRTSFKSAAMAVGFGLALIAPAAATEKVVIGELQWTGYIAIENVMKVVMEKYLDAEVEILAADEPIIWEAMDKGDGSIDIMADVWSQHVYPWLAKYAVKGSRESVRLNDRSYKGTEGMFVPGYVQDQYGIKSITDLNKPEIAKIFDADGNGKGEWWAGAVGWQSSDHELMRAKGYGYDQTMEPYNVEQWAFEAKLDGAYQKKEPIAFYFWTPEWIFAAYDLRKLEEPKFTGYSMASAKDDPLYNPEGCYYALTSAEDPQWLEKSSINCAKPEVDVYVGYSTSLAGRAPKIGQFLKQIAFTPDMVNGWILKISKEKMDPHEMAKQWVDANAEIVEGQWLADISY